jgi:protease I
MDHKNIQKRAVVITAQGFEDEEVIYPVIRLKEAGFAVDIATKSRVLAIGRKAYPLETLVKFYASLVDATKLQTDDYELVIIPGGFEGPDRVRQIPEVLEFVRSMEKAGKIVAAVCHGPWILISAGLLKGKKATGYAGIIDDIKNAGADFIDQPVVEDGNIITGQHARNLPEFMEAVLRKFI